MSDLLEYIEVKPAGPHRATVIWLHGLGADGHDFQPVVPELGLANELGVRFIFPHAPQRPVTINQGMVMRAWYDIKGFDFREPDAEGIAASSRSVMALLGAEIGNGIPASRIALAGFSQGGAIALHCGLRYPEQLSGIIALSCYLPLQSTVASQAHPANKPTPFFIGHGRQDPVVAFERGETSKSFLEDSGYAVEWHSYPMPHSVCQEELQHIGAFLTRVLA